MEFIDEMHFYSVNAPFLIEKQYYSVNKHTPWLVVVYKNKKVCKIKNRSMHSLNGSFIIGNCY